MCFIILLFFFFSLPYFMKSSFKFFPVFEFGLKFPPQGGGMVRIYIPGLQQSKVISFLTCCGHRWMNGRERCGIEKGSVTKEKRKGKKNGRVGRKSMQCQFDTPLFFCYAFQRKVKRKFLILVQNLKTSSKLLSTGGTMGMNR